jgi:formylglycine-generating enzyme required for sulfatase activity
VLPFEYQSDAKLLMAHQNETPRPLAAERPDVPQAVSELVARMLAKNPADRPQSPTEVAQALLPYAKGEKPLSVATALSTGTSATKVEQQNVLAMIDQARGVPAAGHVGVHALACRGSLKAGLQKTLRRNWLPAAITAIALAAILIAFFAGLLKIRTPEGTIALRVNEPDAEVSIDGQTVTVQWGPDHKTAEITAPSGKHQVEVKKSGFTVQGKELTVTDGDREILTVSLESSAKSQTSAIGATVPETGGVRRSDVTAADDPAKPNTPAASRTAPPLAIAPFDEKQAKEHQQVWAKYLGVPVEMSDSIGMNFTLVPPGEFKRGDWPQFRVRITRPFYLATYETMVGQFRRFVIESNYKTDPETSGKGALGWTSASPNQGLTKPEFTWRSPGFPQDDNHPVVAISWNDANAFCRWLSGKENCPYRLPTEAEWEMSCRAGTTAAYSFGDNAANLSKFGNCRDQSLLDIWPKADNTVSWSDGHPFTAPVGQFRLNPYGLYDVHGNASEMCADWFSADYYSASPLDDPTGPASGGQRVARGGDWETTAEGTRSGARYHLPSADGFAGAGFRVLREVEIPKERRSAAEYAGAQGNSSFTGTAVSVNADAQKAEIGQVAALAAPDLSRAPVLYRAVFKDWPRGDGRISDKGERDGKYYIAFHTDTWGHSTWTGNQDAFSDFASEVVGRVTEGHGRWGICFYDPGKTASHGRVFCIGDDGKARVEPATWETDKASIKTIGPFTHSAIKAGNASNAMLLVVRDRKVEFYVNSIAVCDPVPIDRDNLTFTIVFQTDSPARDGTVCRAEFERATVWSVAGLPKTSAADVVAIKGRPGGDNEGTINGDSIDFTWHDDRGGNGKFTLKREMQPGAAANSPRQKQVDLLKLVDLKRDVVNGNWTAQNGELTSNAVQHARVSFPYTPPDEYDFEVTFTRASGSQNVAQICIGGRRQFVWEMSGWGGKVSGFSLVGGKLFGENPTRTDFGLTTGRRYTSLLKVRKDRVQAWVDGKLIDEWKTDFSDMSMYDLWSVPDRRVLGIGSWESPTTFHSAKLTEVSSEGTVISQ